MVHDISQGRPQGSLFSPILFNILTKYLHENNNKFNIIQFADDFVICNANTGYISFIYSLSLHITEIELNCILLASA